MVQEGASSRSEVRQGLVRHRMISTLTVNIEGDSDESFKEGNDVILLAFLEDLCEEWREGRA